MQRPQEDVHGLYLHRERPTAIVATKFKDEIYYEVDGEIARTATDPFDAFGQVVQERFAASALRRIRPGQRYSKRTDWPAFKASGLKSVAGFEREYLAYSVTGANEANITVRLESPPLEWGLSLTTHCNPADDMRLGGRLCRMHRQYLKWEAR